MIRKPRDLHPAFLMDFTLARFLKRLTRFDKAGKRGIQTRTECHIVPQEDPFPIRDRNDHSGGDPGPPLLFT
jgi:hypothetical protein